MSILSIINWPILLSISPLLSISVLVIYSSSRELAIQQGLFVAVGLLLYFFIVQFDYKMLKNYIYPFYLLVIVLLVVVMLLGIETRGSMRWIPLGIFNIQPSEFAKPALILLLANFWSKNAPSWKNIFKSILLTAPVGGLIYKQPDLGTFLTILAIWIGMLFASRISWKKIFVLVLVFVLTVPIVWTTLHEYQKQRITGFLSPSSDPLGIGYNIIQSTIAVGSGQIMGRGLGHGTQSRLQFLPEFRTDFIFASIAEELGLVGSLFILFSYLFLLSYVLQQAHRSYDGFGYLIVFGVASMLVFQLIVNMGMNMGIFPITGITLPLVSYGGSSMITTLICLGLIGSVIKYRRKENVTPLEE